MNWKFACKICGKTLDDEKTVMLHWLTEHRDVNHYAVPMVFGDLPVPFKRKEDEPAPEPVKKLGRPKSTKEREETEDGEYEDEELNFDE